jgi:hypothetical protein
MELTVDRTGKNNQQNGAKQYAKFWSHKLAATVTVYAPNPTR